MGQFQERLQRASSSNRSLVCIGLDPDPQLMAIPDVYEFNRAIVDATADLVCAYKPNFAFYEAQGLAGLRALENTIDHIRRVAPGVVLIGDCKRGDIDSSSKMYARALFESWGVDAATVNGWGGEDSLEPYFEYDSKGVFIWCRSSNPSATDFQDVGVPFEGESIPLYEWLAIKAVEWNRSGNVGIVVGATYPEQLGSVRDRCPGMPILVPGIGAQGGDLKRSVAHGMDADVSNLIVSSSRGVLYRSRDSSRFEEAARNAAERLRKSINDALTELGRPW